MFNSFLLKVLFTSFLLYWHKYFFINTSLNTYLLIWHKEVVNDKKVVFLMAILSASVKNNLFWSFVKKLKIKTTTTTTLAWLSWLGNTQVFWISILSEERKQYRAICGMHTQTLLALYCNTSLLIAVWICIMSTGFWLCPQNCCLICIMSTGCLQWYCIMLVFAPCTQHKTSTKMKAAVFTPSFSLSLPVQSSCSDSSSVGSQKEGGSPSIAREPKNDSAQTGHTQVRMITNTHPHTHILCFYIYL